MIFDCSNLNDTFVTSSDGNYLNSSVPTEINQYEPSVTELKTTIDNLSEELIYSILIKVLFSAVQHNDLSLVNRRFYVIVCSSILFIQVAHFQFHELSTLFDNPHWIDQKSHVLHFSKVDTRVEAATNRICRDNSEIRRDTVERDLRFLDTASILCEALDKKMICCEKFCNGLFDRVVYKTHDHRVSEVLSYTMKHVFNHFRKLWLGRPSLKPFTSYFEHPDVELVQAVMLEVYVASLVIPSRHVRTITKASSVICPRPIRSISRMIVSGSSSTLLPRQRMKNFGRYAIEIKRNHYPYLKESTVGRFSKCSQHN